MGHHRKTYTARWSVQRQAKIDSQGEIRIPLELQSGDPGRSVDLCLTNNDLDSITKAVQEARLNRATEQAREQQRQRTFALQLRVWELERQTKDLERQKGEMEGMIERVHDVVHPRRSSAVVNLDRPDIVPKTSDVAH